MTTTGVFPVAWKRCVVCSDNLVFKSPREFCRHLRDVHCTKEGGSYVCKYGPTGVCPSLPVDGVSDKDYEDHVARDHVAGMSSTDHGGGTANSTVTVTNKADYKATGPAYQTPVSPQCH